MIEMKRRRPDLRDKADSDILEILEREHGPPGPCDLADLARFLECDKPDDLEITAKMLLSLDHFDRIKSRFS